MDRIESPGTPLAAHLSRRGLAGLGAGAVLAAMVAVRQAAPVVAKQDATTPVPFEGDAYVGVTNRPDLFAAIVVGSEEARGYLCDGSSLVTWFTGPATAEPMTLTSEAGDTMTLAWRGGAIDGDCTLADGATVTFDAMPATGMAGLYEVVVDGARAFGAAAGGLVLQAVVAGTLSDGTLLIAGAVALPEGGLRPLAVFASPDSAGVQRWIVLDDGRVTGGPKRGAGAGRIEMEIELAVPDVRPVTDGTSNS